MCSEYPLVCRIDLVLLSLEGKFLGGNNGKSSVGKDLVRVLLMRNACLR